MGKIDPFEPLVKAEPVPVSVSMAIKKKKSKRRIPRTPLEMVDLSQLKLTGIIRAPSGNKAMVEEASGKGYVIAKGTYIGIHSGRVIQILNDRVIVEEEVEDSLGNLTIQKRELKFRKPTGE
jgi:type IV pilus assembly protein PilP